MPEFKVTVTSGYKQIDYVQADDWEQAEEIASTTEDDPDFEEFETDTITVEEVEGKYLISSQALGAAPSGWSGQGWPR